MSYFWYDDNGLIMELLWVDYTSLVWMDTYDSNL